MGRETKKLTKGVGIIFTYILVHYAAQWIVPSNHSAREELTIEIILGPLTFADAGATSKLKGGRVVRWFVRGVRTEFSLERHLRRRFNVRLECLRCSTLTLWRRSVRLYRTQLDKVTLLTFIQ